MLTLLYWIYCLAFAFDFRGEEGGSAIQYVFVLAAMASGSVIILAGRKHLLLTPGAYLIILWWAYLFSSPIVAKLQNVPMSYYIRCSLPLFLLGLSLLVMQVMGLVMKPRKLLMPLVVAGSISIVWRAIYALVIKGIPISQIRYELLSPAAPLFIAYAIVALFFSQRKIPWDVIICGGVTFGSLFISITRSYIATAGFAFLACVALMYISLRQRQWTVKLLYAKLRQTAMLATIGIVLAGVIAAANPMVVERWFSRLFENAGTGKDTSMDVTMLTRLAEADAMFDTLSEHPHRYIFGVGLGATYQWDEAYSQELILVYGSRDKLNEVNFFPGHSTWIYAIFSGGYFGLAIYILLFIAAIAFAWRVHQKFSQPGIPPDEYRALPLIATLCYLSQTLTANPFGDRFAGLILGLIFVYPQAFLNEHRLAMLRYWRNQQASTESSGPTDRPWATPAPSTS